MTRGHMRAFSSASSSVKTSTSRRLCVRVVSGERRSANRTKWSNTEGSFGTSTSEGSRYTSVVSEAIWETAQQLQPTFHKIDQRISRNVLRVQQAFRDHMIGPHHFSGSTGYGHGDLGREALDKVMAQVMGAESALVRIQFMSGTHAIAAALFAVLRPGDEMLAVTGHPYDTLEEVIGTRGTPGRGSLQDWGVSYRELALTADGRVDYEAIRQNVKPGVTKVAHVQRSCGYALRPTLSISDIQQIVAVVKDVAPDCLVLVDNCYGEFTEELEPCVVGADLVMGSLIKNPGGTIAPGGGYVAGREDLIEAVNARLSAPGLGTDSGCVSGSTLRTLFQGLFLAPQTVGEAMKGGQLIAEVLRREGFKTHPTPGWCEDTGEAPSMITAVELGSRDLMTAFCRAVQTRSPVGSYVRPVPGQTAGYGDEVIFADGTFIDGSTAELSADGPLRPPFVVYCQGGTHWTHWALVLEPVLEALRLETAKSTPVPSPPRGQLTATAG